MLQQNSVYGHGCCILFRCGTVIFTLILNGLSIFTFNLPLVFPGEPLVVSAPTGSGKTVIFELAIIHLLMSFENQAVPGDFKIVYSKLNKITVEIDSKHFVFMISYLL